MLADTLFQPYHIVPAAELVAAAVKFAGNAVFQALVKGKAAFVQIFVRRLRTGKTGIHIQNIHGCKNLFQGCVERATNAAAPVHTVYINGGRPEGSPVNNSTLTSNPYLRISGER